MTGLLLLLALTASGCGRDDGAGVRNLGDDESETSSGSESGSPSGPASSSASVSGSSSATGAAHSFGRGDADAKLAYTLVDYEFQGPREAAGPKVWFTAVNEGSESHELEVLDSQGEALGEIAVFAPGEDADPLALELEPDTYTLQCILETEEGESHRDLGMVLELAVT